MIKCCFEDDVGFSRLYTQVSSAFHIVSILRVARWNWIAAAIRCYYPMKIYKFQNSINCPSLIAVHQSLVPNISN